MDEVTAVRQETRGKKQFINLELLYAMRNLRRVLDILFTGTGYLAGGLFVVLAFFVTYDVLARKWGSYVGLPTTRVTDEISGYMLALAATWGFAYALRTDAHVRIDVLLPYMPQRLRAIMDFFALVLMGLFALIVSWKIWALVLDSLQTGITSSTYLLTPLYIPQGILGVGFSLLVLAAMLMALSILAEWVWSWMYGVSVSGEAAAPALEMPADPPGAVTGGK